MRQTSIDSYNKLKVSGKLNKINWLVYETLFNFGPMTQTECWKKITEVSDPSMLKDTVKPRFAVLDKWGLIANIGTRPCSITNEMVILWDVTSASEKKALPKISNKEKATLIYRAAKEKIRALGFIVVWSPELKGLILQEIPKTK